MDKTDVDRVCHRQVPSTSFATEHAGSHYAFCSVQCRDRFLEHPHLYIGYPGSPAPAQQGRQVIKRHRLMLSASLDVTQAEKVKRALYGMVGVQEVEIEENRIEIQYDLIIVTMEQIAEKIESTGAHLGEGWLDRLKFALINNLEEIEANSLEVEKPNGLHYPIR